MKITFGIVTCGSQDSRLLHTIQSIRKQVFDDYQIIIVGNTSLTGPDILRLEFDESIKNMWVTKKKNLITANAMYDNIVYMHDYIALCDDWYDGVSAFGENYDVCMTKIINFDGSRYRDWVLFPPFFPAELAGRMDCLIPYDVMDLQKYMYFSGAYWIAKKHVMEEFPLDESLVWGEGEDVVWSQLIKNKYKFSMNTLATVIVNKPNKWRVFHDASPDLIEKLRRVSA